MNVLTDEVQDKARKAERYDAHAEAIQAAAQAATRADNGEFILVTRDEVSAFVNALPSGVRVRWLAEPQAMFGIRYRVTFWRSFWSGSGRKTSEASATKSEETTQP